MVLADQRTSSPSLFDFITLITYQFSLLLLVCLACPLLALLLRTLADTTWYKCVGLSTYVILSFFISFYCRTNHFILVCSKVFHPPWVLSPTFHFPLPFSPSWLPSASLLLCLFALFVASVAPVRFWVSWTDRCCGRSAALLTHGQHHTWTRAIKHVCGGFPPERPVSPGNVCASAPLPPPCPRGYYWQTPRPSQLNRVLVYTTHDLAAVERSRCLKQTT